MGRMMTELFLNELIGALLQLLLFSLLPFITWLIFYRKKESFLKWIGLKKVEHAGKRQITIMAVIMATALYRSDDTCYQDASGWLDDCRQRFCR